MKAVALVYLMLIGFLTVQPLLASQSLKPTGTCCKKEGCSKKNQEPKKDTDCRNKSCNPFIACPFGNFYLLSNNRILLGNLLPDKIKTHLHNDNRLSSLHYECWHPPQI